MAGSRGWILTVGAWLLASALGAQAPPPSGPVVIPTPGGKVVSVDAGQHALFYDDWHFAPARVEGGLIFVSGVVAGPREPLVLDGPGFEAALRRAFQQIEAQLVATGSSSREIVDLLTFHVFASPSFRGTKAEHLAIFRRIKDEFVKPPYPSWTGVGVAELFPDGGLVEIRVVARLPTPKP
jgi:enamine deaminase RidA (YjgF/YER057c/UK114 family)